MASEKGIIGSHKRPGALGTAERCVKGLLKSTPERIASSEIGLAFAFAVCRRAICARPKSQPGVLSVIERMGILPPSKKPGSRSPSPRGEKWGSDFVILGLKE